MKIASKFPGTCAHCGAAWSEGEEIEFRRNCSPICPTCSSAGRTPPEKTSAPPKNPASASPASVPAGSDGRALTEAAVKIETLLKEILAELRAARQKSIPASPPASLDGRVEVPF